MKRERKKLERLNWIDILILNGVWRHRKALVKEIGHYLKEYYRKNNPTATISYNFLYQRINRLLDLNLIVSTCEKPLILKINPALYEDIEKFIVAYITLEDKLWKFTKIEPTSIDYESQSTENSAINSPEQEQSQNSQSSS